jgi:hypothetical protein
MVHVAAGIFRVEAVQLLGFAGRAQGHDGENLGLAAPEEAGAVGAGLMPVSDDELAYVAVAAAVWANAVVKNLVAHGLFVLFVDGFGDGFDIGRFVFGTGSVDDFFAQACIASLRSLRSVWLAMIS